MAVARSLGGQTVLVVEDEGLQALDVLAALQSHGAEVIAAQTLEDAISAAARQKSISVAVLDIVLQGGKDCTLICRYLQETRVPFVFLTAHTKHHILADFPTVPVIAKTAHKEQLLECLAEVIGNGGSRRRYS